MRWKSNQLKFKKGDVLIRKNFAWLPTRMATDDIVWLESYYIGLEAIDDSAFWFPDTCDKFISASGILEWVKSMSGKNLTSPEVMARLEADAKREAANAENAP